MERRFEKISRQLLCEILVGIYALVLLKHATF